MTINYFKLGRSATTDEQKLYPLMTEMKFIKSWETADTWGDMIDFGKENFKKVYCSAIYTKIYTPPRGVFYCAIDYLSFIPEEWYIPKESRIGEIRYGDIDKDGDIDIAIKLIGGAVYIFQNSDK